VWQRARSDRVAGGQALSLRITGGWNLITPPLIATAPLSASTVLGTLLASTGGSLAALYGLTHNAWSPSLIDMQGRLHGVDFAVAPGSGYLLYSDRAGTLSFTGNVASTLPSWALSAGWNVVGLPQQAAAGVESASVVLRSLIATTGGTLTAIYSLHNDAWSLGLLIQGGQSTGQDFALQPGTGYLLYSAAAAPAFALPGPLPPDPSTLAPPLDTSVSTNVLSATSFLYSGANPVQTGMVSGTIVVTRAAVLRGRVLDRGDNPLSGVTIGILGHPEYGQTLTRADGMFDMVVNGGGMLTVTYARQGYIAVQRQALPHWLGFARLPDVTMLPYDARVSAINLAAAAPVQVALGSAVTDADGSRQATLLFTAGMTATMTLPGGAVQPLSTLHVRATELTVGATGRSAMPGDLPPTSAYTYAVDFSADEARGAGATGVQFSQPVYSYVQNFLGFPAGQAVPTAYYDPGQGTWVPAANGLVLRILSITNGMADIDLRTGTPATPIALADLGFTDAERAELAHLYPVGTSLWRVPISHFSLWDYNWGREPPQSAAPPDPPAPDGPGPMHDPNCQSGSIIECQTQTLSEQLGINGTPYQLVYRGDRVPGRAASRSLRIPLIGATVPISLTRIDLEIDVAGQQVTQSFPPNPNQTYLFTWNGQDAYGRTLQGQQPVTVRIGYVYPLIYSEPDDKVFNVLDATICTTPVCHLLQRQAAQDTSGFPCPLPLASGAARARADAAVRPADGGAIPCTDYWALYQQMKYSAFGHFTYQGVPVSADRERGEITLWQETHPLVGPWDARGTDGLGGWTLNIHHTYDPQSQALYLGDGTTRSAANVLYQRITTVAGYGGGAGQGDGGQATAASLVQPQDVVVAPNGSLYILDGYQGRVRRVTPDGIITTVVGPTENAHCDFSGDGGPATAAFLCQPQGLAIGRDGSLYIADTLNQRIRRVGPDGVINTVAGSGPPSFNGGFGGDDGPATAAQLARPQDVAVTADGTLYIADTLNNRIRRVGPDGIITTVAGNGTAGFAGDGGPAAQAILNGPSAVAIGPDGSVYIADANNDRIRRIGTDGVISTVAGNGCLCYANNGDPLGDGGPATSAGLSDAQSVSVGPDGTLYIVDTDNERIRAVGPDGLIRTIAGGGTFEAYGGDGGTAKAALLALPLHTRSGVAVAPDGSIYIADMDNERVRRVAPILPTLSHGEMTIAAEDGSQLYVFDSAGRHLRTLNALTGAIAYQFQYDAAGHLSAVVDGDGNMTAIVRNSHGDPTTIVAPHGQRTALALDSNGYLSRVSDPLGATVALTYTQSGLLTGLSDPLGHLHQFSYDELGRLAQDQNAAQGVKTLTRTDNDTAYTVTVTTAQDATHSYATAYQVDDLPTGDQRRLIEQPDGLQRQIEENADGSIVTTEPSGAGSTVQLGPDPRWSMQAPVAATQVLTTSGGLRETVSTTEKATLANPDDLLSLATLTSQTSINGSTYSTTYDGATRTITSASPLGRQETLTIDLHGRIVQDQIGGLLPRKYSYDSNGRLVGAAQGSGAALRASSYAYDGAGHLATLANPLSQTIHLAYDAGGRVTRETLPDGGVVQYGYDANGNVTSVIPPGRPAHLFTYTANNQLATYTAPDVGNGEATTTYSYMDDGQLASITRPDGHVVRFAYDGAGRLQSESQARGTTTYTYDGQSGNLATITAPDGGSLTYTFDGSLPTGERWQGTVAGSVLRTYDNNLRVASLSVNGAGTTYAYDADNLLTHAGSLALARDAQDGLLTGTTLGAVTDNWTYNGFGEPSAYSAAYNGAAFYGAQYNRDQQGRISALTETIGGATHTFSFTYDLAGRLTQVNRDGTPVERYAYDANGNRLTAITPGGSVAASYDQQDRLQHYGTSTYVYGANGELLSVTSAGHQTTYSYDDAGNLMQVTLPGGTTIGYVVDGTNRRIGKLVNGAQVQGFLYQDSLHPIAELDGNNAVISRFIYGSRPNVPDYMVKAGVTYRIIADQLGSPRLVMNVATGQIEQRMDYDTFGNVTADTNPGFQPFGFAGGLYDRDTHLVHFGLRDYDATTGRWVSRDPLLFAGGGTDFYSYVGNDPVNAVDPTGLIFGWGDKAKKVAKAIAEALDDDPSPPDPPEPAQIVEQNKAPSGNSGQCAPPPPGGPGPNPTPPTTDNGSNDSNKFSGPSAWGLAALIAAAGIIAVATGGAGAAAFALAL
jgi:RHS repeat-associated protein